MGTTVDLWLPQSEAGGDRTSLNAPGLPPAPLGNQQVDAAGLPLAEPQPGFMVGLRRCEQPRARENGSPRPCASLDHFEVQEASGRRASTGATGSSARQPLSRTQAIIAVADASAKGAPGKATCRTCEVKA